MTNNIFRIGALEFQPTVRQAPVRKPKDVVGVEKTVGEVKSLSLIFLLQLTHSLYSKFSHPQIIWNKWKRERK